jgi:hypothetical protein
MAITKVITPDLIDLPTTISSVETNTDGVVLAKGSTSGTASVEYLVVAGGGAGGGWYRGGGGGAGELKESTIAVDIGVQLNLTVGTGGGGVFVNSSGGSNGNNGINSTFDSITSLGGGGGSPGNSASGIIGSDGGSGGGSGGNWVGTTASGGSAIGTGSGNNGGNGGPGSSSFQCGGGGGGATQVGFNAGASNTDGYGGAGKTYSNVTSITGSAFDIAGGGGGANYDLGNVTQGGTGGGAAGASGSSPYANGPSAANNTGSGGGGGNGDVQPSSGSGGAGGSGVVILRTVSTTTATFVNATTSLTQVGGGAWTSGDKVYTITETTGTATVTFSSTASGGRPVTGGSYILKDGEFRYNTTTKKVEYYDGASWFTLISTTAVPQAGTTGACNYPVIATALYQFNDNANDTCGSYNAIATNITYTTGKFSNAAVFSGSSSYITTPVDFSTFTDYSVSMWIYPTATGAGTATGTGFGGTVDAGTDYGFFLSINSSNQIRFYERTGSPETTLTSSNAVTLNTWNNIVAIRDGSTNYIYVNNIATSLANYSTITYTSDFIFGRAGLYASDSYTGNIDQARIFPSALTSAQVTALYEETAP